MFLIIILIVIFIVWILLSSSKSTEITPRSSLDGYTKPQSEDVEIYPSYYTETDLIAYTYYKGLGDIEERYSVLYNMGLIDGSEIDDFILMCKNNITEYKLYSEILQKDGLEVPHSVPAYKRLAMIYEKQGNYKEAIEVCAEAINNQAYDDGTKGRMRGRLARLIRKYDGDVPQNILRLLD